MGTSPTNSRSDIRRWDTNTLSWVVWDGSLTANGPITIGTVNQGNAGAQMWKVDASGAVVPISGAVDQGNAGPSDWRIDERRGQTILFAPIDVATNGDNTIVAAVGGNKIKVLSYDLVVGGPVSVRWKSGAATSLNGALPFVANSGISSPVATPAGGHLFETALGQALVLNLSAPVQVSGRISYFVEP